MSDAPLVEMIDVSKDFDKNQGRLAKAAARLNLGPKPERLRAVDGVNLTINPGEVVGLAGESGCGKSTLGRMVIGNLAPTGGNILYQGQALETLSKEERTRARLKFQMVFQDPFSSLNPRMRVSEIIGEAPRVHSLVSGDMREFLVAQLERVGLDEKALRRYPHQFSGGQRQRICIARALAVNPEFLVCDESVASLDVSIQAQILNLIMELRETLGLTYLFITHDLSVVEHIADRVAIMYLGRVVEQARTEDLFTQPNHPYTKALLSEIPKLEVRRRAFSALKGELPSPLNPPSGCHFHPRCPLATERCRVEAPQLRQIGTGHQSACHLNG